VLVNGIAAPLIYIGPNQIIFQMPYEMTLGQASVVVASNSIASAAAPVTVQAAAPFILTYGSNRAVAVNQDGSINGPNTGAKPGSYAVVYLIGSGPLDNPIPTGAFAPLSPLSQEKLATTVTVGGTAADMKFAGMTPDFAGLVQVNFVVPNLGPRDYLLQISIGSSKQPAAADGIAIAKFFSTSVSTDLQNLVDVSRQTRLLRLSNGAISSAAPSLASECD
jgi:uncharacterized protein (TIGR03437 family)